MNNSIKNIYSKLCGRLAKRTVMVCLVLSVGGCSNVLDISPDGRLNIEDFFKDNDKTAAVLNECYNFLPLKGLHYANWTNFPTAVSDEAWAYAGEEVLASYYLNRLNAENHPFLSTDGGMTYNNLYNYWSKYFEQIRYCTIFIQNIDNANVDSPTNKLRWKAEAHVLRAYYMSELMKWYGGFPLNGMNLYEDDYDYSKAVRNSVWEVAQAIESDCRAAIEIDNSAFPYRNSYVATQTSQTRGDELRVNKAVAWALMSKAYLFAASNLHCGGVSQSDRTERWKKAYDINKEAVTALESNGYELYRNNSMSIYSSFGSAAAFYELNSSFLAPELDHETLWQNNMVQASSFALNSLPMPNVKYVAFWPSQELVDAFEVVSATPSGSITAAEPLLELSAPYAGTGHLNPNYNDNAITMGYDEHNPYVNRDPRFKATILCNGDVITWNGTAVPVETFVGGEHGIAIGSGSKLNTKTGYYARKFMRPGSSPNSPLRDPAWKYFRLAEIKLNYAEAAAEYAKIKGGDQTIQNEAARQVNDIRSRVGMPSVAGTWVSDVDRLILRVRNERRVELAFEECRYFDVRRWANPDSDLASTDAYISAMKITKNGSALTYERIHCNDKNSGPTREGWQRKFLFLPVYKADVIRMQNATGVDWQNPGW